MKRERRTPDPSPGSFSNRTYTTKQTNKQTTCVQWSDSLLEGSALTLMRYTQSGSWLLEAEEACRASNIACSCWITPSRSLSRDRSTWNGIQTD